MFSTPNGAAKLLLATVLGLFALKLAVGVVTGSISIWAQAVDSSLDIFAVVITFLTVGFSAKPADQEHPFGHGKIEYIAAGVQAILLLVASATIIYSAIQRIIRSEVIQLTEAGIGIMLVSMVTSIFLSRHLFKVARASGSAALEANANNIMGDIFSTGGVLVGLTVVRFTGLTIIDPIMALMVSLFILRATYMVGQTAFGGLIDVRLPKEEEDILVSTIKEHTGQLISFHDMRTRKSGMQRFIDLHLLMPKNASIEDAHRVTDHLEEDIRNRLPNSNVTIHVEPCTVESPSINCQECPETECNMNTTLRRRYGRR